MRSSSVSNSSTWSSARRAARRRGVHEEPLTSGGSEARLRRRRSARRPRRRGVDDCHGLELRESQRRLVVHLWCVTPSPRRGRPHGRSTPYRRPAAVNGTPAGPRAHAPAGVPFCIDFRRRDPVARPPSEAGRKGGPAEQRSRAPALPARTGSVSLHPYRRHLQAVKESTCSTECSNSVRTGPPLPGHPRRTDHLHGHVLHHLREPNILGFAGPPT